MEGWGQIPSQPSNYVSILHLRERWLKENERDQKLDQQEQQQNVLQTEPEEKDDQKPVVQKPQINASSWSRNGSRNESGKFHRYYQAVPAIKPRNVNKTCKKTEDEGEPQLAVSQIERDEKKGKKSKRKGRKKNPRLQKEVMDKTSPAPEENLKEEMKETECEVRVEKGEKNVRARKIDKKKGTGNQCGPEKTGYMHEMKEMENKLSLTSASFEIKRERNNGVYRGSRQANRNFGDRRNLVRWGPRKQRDVGMIWVRKDELSKVA